MRAPLLATVMLVLLTWSATSATGQRRHGSVNRIDHELSEMVVIAAGTFTMGLDDGESAELVATCLTTHPGAEWACSEKVQILGLFGTMVVGDDGDLVSMGTREVFVDGFEIDRYEVTADEYRDCVAAGACDVGALVSGDELHLRGDLPMVYVTWQDAVDYCSYRGKRLPSEAEWEKSARGSDGRRWPWGNHERLDGANLGKSEAYAVRLTQGKVPRFTTSASISSIPDASDGHLWAARPGKMRWSGGPYGVYDMAGNVSEWVADYFSIRGYAGLPSSNPLRTTAAPNLRRRVVRGGGWSDWKYHGRTYFRWHGQPEARSESRGFRCARDLRTR